MVALRKDRAGLRQSPKLDAERALKHTFRNLLINLTMCTQLEDRQMMTYYIDELEAAYAVAMKR